MRIVPTTLFLATALVLTACKRDEPAPAEPAPAPQASTPAEAAHGGEHAASMVTEAAATTTATAELKPTKGNDVKGTVTFKTVDGALRVTGQLSGLKPNTEHGFHIHEKGDCSAPDGSSAGGHFNPSQSDHGNISAEPHHGGDMPNIKSDAQGNASIDGPVSSNVNLGKADQFDIAGHAVIVHADADDYKTQPTGNAGGRLACGVITTDNAQAPTK
ncbi:superoxide dismutase family protein [Xanthomonas citri]|uniref:superoxide dismutase family protein n=1 Tax=Xanthomonas citri TaxID=346 RepID=UPI0002DCD1C5|nr:superoxide dismutase family protein [Xanthomonas citri]AMU96852.1 superoxide dismutase [Xanthomonas citri pv. aurantifolii]AMV01196.1 superoxide dismutase [Xanthomonas citri pv. aurantifolii]MCC8491840.1 superoxide dismutase family protein [Xanthomonas citri pv. fuscans]TBW98050.1 superoxide dismutase [Xanthomonas citri pv. aurantifolii]TBX00539.1 superoxide dismutase [Xanthomonas citri pv. aurantifolii]